MNHKLTTLRRIAFRVCCWKSRWFYIIKPINKPIIVPTTLSLAPSFGGLVSTVLCLIFVASSLRRNLSLKSATSINICLKAIHILILFRDNVFKWSRRLNYSSLSYPSIQTMINFLSRAARQRDIKMCNRSTSIELLLLLSSHFPSLALICGNF